MKPLRERAAMDSWTVDVSLGEGEWPDGDEAADWCSRAACAALDSAGRTGPAEISVLLGSDAEIRGLNRRFRGRDRATNVLSFPSGAAPWPGGPPPLGEIALAGATICREAIAQQKTLHDHLCHLVVHGVLHLLGFDHRTEEEAARMERLEVLCLETLSIADPYRETG